MIDRATVLATKDIFHTWEAIYDALRRAMGDLDEATLTLLSQAEGNQAVADTATDELRARGTS